MPAVSNDNLPLSHRRQNAKNHIAESICGKSGLSPDEMRAIGGAGSDASPAGTWTIGVGITVAFGCFTFDTTACAGTCGAFTKGCC